VIRIAASAVSADVRVAVARRGGVVDVEVTVFLIVRVEREPEQPCSLLVLVPPVVIESMLRNWSLLSVPVSRLKIRITPRFSMMKSRVGSSGACVAKIGRVRPDVTSLVESVWAIAEEPTNMPARTAAEVRSLRLIDMGKCFLFRLGWCGLGLNTCAAPESRNDLRRSTWI
jgi:hypothetical protein